MNRINLVMLAWVICFLSIAGYTNITLAQNQVGTTAAAFLEIPVGPRAIGMGQAYVASANDVSALYWNPAGIALLDNNQATFQYTDWFIDTSLNYAAGVIKVNNAYFGANVYMFNGGTMDVTTVQFPDGTGEEFTINDISLGLSYAQKLKSNFSIGGTFKFIRTSLWRMDANTFAVDLGFHYKTPIENLDLGFSITNFGGELELEGDNVARRIDLDPNASGNNDAIIANLDTDSWDLPLFFRIGLAYKMLKENNFHQLIISSDAVYPNSNNNYVNVGLEYGFRDMVFLRAGYSYMFLDRDDGTGHLRAGFGIKVIDQITADYAFSDRSILGSVHTLGAAVNF